MSFDLNDFPTDAFIDGICQPSASGNRFDVTNPATGEVIASVADCGAEDAILAIAAAERAQKKWARVPAGQRSQILFKWRDLLLVHADDLAVLLCREMGKPLAEAKGEVLYGASFLDWFAEEAKRVYGDIIPSASPDNRIIVTKQPVGVCATVTPWNFPNAMLMRKAAAALAAGCSLVAKPAEDTPLSALALAQLASDAGVPAGLLNITPTRDPAAVGLELTTNPTVRKFSFTGSTAVGKKLMAQCASTVKRVSLELGGNAPFIIFEDADIDAAIAGLMASKYRNAGQTCVCANRVFVHHSIMDEVADKLTAQVESLNVAKGEEAGSQVGPLINMAALEKSEQLVASAIASGATLVTGGTRHDAGDLFYTPSILKNVTMEMDISGQEIFGPIAPLISFDSEDEVVRMANDTPYGLASYFYTRDLGRAWRVGEALEFGMVGINEGIVSTATAPFGGIKESGFGREGSRYGLEDYLEIKYMLIGGLAS